MEFETKDSGVRSEYASGMVRDTQAGKPRFGLLRASGIPYADQFITRMAALAGRGADKYGDRNHELSSTPEELERFQESAERHFNQWVNGETDEDHAAAVAFNLFMAESCKYRMSQAPTEEQYAEAYPEGSTRGRDRSSGDSFKRSTTSGLSGPGQKGSSSSDGDVPGSGPVVEGRGHIQPVVYQQCVGYQCAGTAKYPASDPYACSDCWCGSDPLPL